MKTFEKIKKKAKKSFTFETWNIGIIKCEIHKFLNSDYKNEKIKWFPKKPFGFIADCFGFQLQGKNYIIYEYFNYIIRRGRIDIVELDENLRVKKEYKNVIKENCHLSYPHPIEYENKIYFILESHNANQLFLYKLDENPGKIKKIKTLFEGHVVDPSIVFYKNFWWLFFVKEDFGWDKLFIAYSDSLFGKWEMHKQNPVKVDLASARCGGTLFEYRNDLYRPTQDCSKTYGGAINICKIKKINKEEFEEEIVNAVLPFEDYPEGVHTLSKFRKFSLVDGKGKRFSFLKPLSSLIRNVKRWLRSIKLLSFLIFLVFESPFP